MDKHQVAWGVDIGHSSIKAVKLSRKGNQVVVEGYAIAAITVPEDGDRGEAVVQALAQLAVEEQFGTTPVYMALPGRQVFSKPVNIPLLGERKIDRIVELEARQQVPGHLVEGARQHAQHHHLFHCRSLRAPAFPSGDPRTSRAWDTTMTCPPPRGRAVPPRPGLKSW